MQPTSLPAPAEVLKKIANGVDRLNRALTSGELSILHNRLKFLWARSEQSTNAITGWRQRRSRNAYEEIQDIDNHLFLAVLLSVTPTECGQKKFDLVIAYLRHIGNYDAYNFILKQTTQDALQSQASTDGYDSHERYIRLMKALSKETTQLDPNHNLPDIAFAFTQVPLETLGLLPAWVEKAVKSSTKFAEERDQQLPKTDCVSIVMRPREQDGSIIITAGARTLHTIRNALGMSDWDINRI